MGFKSPDRFQQPCQPLGRQFLLRQMDRGAVRGHELGIGALVLMGFGTWAPTAVPFIS